jgi:hypothetical protein
VRWRSPARVQYHSAEPGRSVRDRVTSHRPRPQHSISVLSGRTRTGGGRFTRPTITHFFRARAESLHPPPSPPTLASTRSTLLGLQNGKDARSRRAIHVQTALAATTSYASRRSVGVTVSATERNAGDSSSSPLSPLLLLHVIDLAGY